MAVDPNNPDDEESSSEADTSPGSVTNDDTIFTEDTLAAAEASDEQGDEGGGDEGEGDDQLRREYEILQSEIQRLVEEFPEGPSEWLSSSELDYLSVLWADFHLHIVDPEIKRKLPAKVTKLANNRCIFDYGNLISTSVGEGLPQGSRSTGKLLESVEEIVKLAIERGATRVELQGHDIGKRRATELCAMNNIEYDYVDEVWHTYRAVGLENLAKKGFRLG